MINERNKEAHRLLAIARADAAGTMASKRREGEMLPQGRIRYVAVGTGMWEGQVQSGDGVVERFRVRKSSGYDRVGYTLWVMDPSDPSGERILDDPVTGIYRPLDNVESGEAHQLRQLVRHCAQVAVPAGNQAVVLQNGARGRVRTVPVDSQEVAAKAMTSGEVVDRIRAALEIE